MSHVTNPAHETFEEDSPRAGAAEGAAEPEGAAEGAAAAGAAATTPTTTSRWKAAAGAAVTTPLFTLNSITDRLAKTLFGEEDDDADGAPPPRPVVYLHRQKRTWRPPSLRHPACRSPSTWPYALSPGTRRLYK